MKHILFALSILLAQPIFGFYAGVGFSWNTIDETFDSYLVTNADKSGKDRYETQFNRLAPMVVLGHDFCFCEDWVAGVSAEWKYLNYKTPNEDSSKGQILPNATFSSINFFGPNVIRDLTSKTRLFNEVTLIGSIGREVLCGYAYLGLGAVLYNASNSIYVSSVHTPNGTGDHLVSTKVKKHKIMWGGAIRIGYEYCFCQDYFMNFSYSYVQTGKSHFKNTINSAVLNGFDTPGPITLHLKRKIQFAVQEFALSINAMF